MKTVICSIFDSAVEAYARPFQAQTAGEAVRMFENEVQNDKSPMFLNSEDYALFELATFNSSTGEIKPHASPQCLSKAWEVEAKVINLKEAN